MPAGPGSRYDAELEEVLRKHKIGRALVLVHQPNTPVEKYEKLLIGQVNREWELTALEGFVNTLEAMNEKGKILTAKPVMPEPNPKDVEHAP
jgi:hypothetical protein